jgi:hypothetical protein
MRRILLAAMAETQQYQRVSMRRAADVALVGAATAGTIHLVAELLDNALTFSPPESPVWISCTRVERGIVVEIEDGGVGMVPDDLAKANELLADAPTPDVTALKDGAQIGFWVVAELARRDGIQVTLRTSAYGGVLAVVLLPERAVAPYAETPTMDLTEGVASIAAPAKAATATATMLPKAAPERARPVTAGRPQLPQRRPQEHLNPQLRDEDPSGAIPLPAVPARSPDQARDRFSRYQHGWRAGREAGAAETPAPETPTGN